MHGFHSHDLSKRIYLQTLFTSYTNHFLHVPYSRDFSKEYHIQNLLTKVTIDFTVCSTYMCTCISKFHPNFVHKCHNSIILCVFTSNEKSKKIALKFFSQIPQINFTMCTKHMQSKIKITYKLLPQKSQIKLSFIYHIHVVLQRERANIFFSQS